MIGFLIQLLIVVIVFGLIYWVIQQLPLGEPFGRIARVVVMVVGVLVIVIMLLGLIGYVPVARLY